MARIPLIVGKTCNECGRKERRADNRKCAFCEFWEVSKIIERPHDYPRKVVNQALAIWIDRVADYRQKIASRRSSNLRRSATGSFTQSQVKAILSAQEGRCAYCSTSENLHLDHAIPISRGGSNWPWNLQWLCAFHNLSKGAKTDAEYRSEIGLPPSLWISLRLWSTALLLAPEILVPEIAE